MTRPRFPRPLAALCVMLLPVLACRVTQGLAGAGSTPTAESAAESPSQADLWLEATGGLRSVNLELIDEYQDGGQETISADIDAKGNMHLSMVVPLSAEITAQLDGLPPGDFELYIVDGAAYTRIGGEGPAVADDSYLTLLADTLLGPQGPGLWLNIVPPEGFTPAGTESYGGFNAARYTVDGELEKGAVTGTIWVDGASGALVGAELTVAGDLFFPPGSNRTGDVRLAFSVRQAAVPAVTLP